MKKEEFEIDLEEELKVPYKPTKKDKREKVVSSAIWVPLRPRGCRVAQFLDENNQFDWMSLTLNDFIEQGQGLFTSAEAMAFIQDPKVIEKKIELMKVINEYNASAVLNQGLKNGEIKDVKVWDSLTNKKEDKGIRYIFLNHIPLIETTPDEIETECPSCHHKFTVTKLMEGDLKNE